MFKPYRGQTITTKRALQITDIKLVSKVEFGTPMMKYVYDGLDGYLNFIEFRRKLFNPVEGDYIVEGEGKGEYYHQTKEQFEAMQIVPKPSEET